MSSTGSNPLERLQETIGYRFNNPELLRLSLIHPSWLQDHPEEPAHNQRLEFLGDSVLAMILTEALYRRYPDEREGVLSKRRSALTNGRFLSLLAVELNLAEFLHMGRAESGAGGAHRPSALEDALEALVGAIYLDSDLATTKSTILKWYGNLERHLARLEQIANPKGRLQELVQPVHGNDALSYRVDQTEGPPHQRSFEVTVFLDDTPLGQGKGGSKKEAEENAALDALDSSELARLTGGQNEESSP